MKCKDCKQKIIFSDWFAWNGRCNPCYFRLREQRRDERLDERVKQQRTSEKYWKAHGCDKTTNKGSTDSNRDPFKNHDCSYDC